MAEPRQADQQSSKKYVDKLCHLPSARVYVSSAETDMGWIHPWLGWVGSHFPAHVIGWVGLGEEKRTLVHLCYTCPAQWKKCCYAPATKVGEFNEGCAHSPLGPLSSPLLLPIPCL